MRVYIANNLKHMSDQSLEESQHSSQEDQNKNQKQKKPRIKSQQDQFQEKNSTREQRKLKQIVQIIESQKQEEAATLKRKRSKPNPAIKLSEEQQTPDEKLDDDQSQEKQPIVLPIQSTEEQQCGQASRLRLNPKLKMKEKQHIFLYLSECYDKCQESIQKMNSIATQMYSPPKSLRSDQTSLYPINQDVFQETQVLARNLKTQFLNDGTKNQGNTTDFINKYMNKNYLESVLRDNRLQIYKRNNLDKPQNGKLIPKKQY
ncbi:hypothetical protein pb186bvf_012664 [Paramecium bursaria]